MFWCLEEKSNDFWQSSNFVACFCFCVSKLKSFVEKDFLPNYFIRRRNQFVGSEFTCDMQTETGQYLEKFLKDPTAGISLLLPVYKDHVNTQMCTLNNRSQTNVIVKWLQNQASMAFGDPFKFGTLLVDLYDGDNIQYIFNRCNEALDKLSNVGYTQILTKKLQNYMGVLQYILLREERERGEHRTDSDLREKYSKYLKSSASGDLTHNTLRIATCYLDDDVKEDCLKMIQRVTDSDGEFFMKTHGQRIKTRIHDEIETFRKTVHDDYEISLYNRIINDVDIAHEDPYKTLEELEQLKANGRVLIGYDSLSLAWHRCYFDVTFMQAEVSILPKPAAVELCLDKDQKTVTFHPFIYGLLLEYLWNEKYGSGNRRKEKESVLIKMKNCISIIPDEHKFIGFNFMAYCYSLQKDNRRAFKCLIHSMYFNPLKTNVAYRYMKYKLEKNRGMSAELMESPRKRKNFSIVIPASAKKKRVPASTSVTARQLTTVDTVTPFIPIIPVTSSTRTYLMLSPQTGAGISNSASTSPVDSMSIGDTLLYSRVSHQNEFNTVTSQDPPEYS